jgi:1-acyl-sn-glycerol-3-phosphate acyltransferase
MTTDVSAPQASAEPTAVLRPIRGEAPGAARPHAMGRTEPRATRATSRLWHNAWYRLVMRLALRWFYGPCRGRIVSDVPVDRLVEGGFVLVANHVSYLDWMVLHALFFYQYREKLVFLAKDRLFSHPLWGPLMTEGGAVRVSNDGSSVLDCDGFRDLRDAKLVAVFPEGKRSPDGRPGKGHSGAVRLAARAGKPIVPVALLGFFETWPPHRRLPRPARCEIRIGAARSISSELATDHAGAAAETRRIMEEIATAVDDYYR